MPQLTLQQVFDLAVKHHQAGQLQQAASLYRQLLNYHPDHADSLHLLGVIEGQNGRLDEAIPLIERALTLKPDDPQFLTNLGVFLARNGRAEDAVAASQRAISLAPGASETHYNLAAALMDAKRFEEAVEEYRQTIALRPDYADAHQGLAKALLAAGRKVEAADAFGRALAGRAGSAVEYFDLANLLQHLGRFEEAVIAYFEALTRKPDFFEAVNNLGNTLQHLGRREEAVARYEQALRLRADCPETHFNLGNALTSLGQIDEGIAAYRRALALRPDYADAINNLGNAFRTRGYYADAVDAFRRASNFKCDSPEAPSNLGLALHAQGHLDESFEAFKRALELNPNFAEAHLNLGNALKDVGRTDEAIACYRRAAELRPDAGMTGNLLYALHFHPDRGPAEIWKEHAAWNERFVRPLAANVAPHTNDPSPQRQLRIGYVSADFRDHPVGRFMLPLLASHDRRRFAIVAYSDLRVPGALTPILRQHFDVWRETLGMSDEKLAEQIRTDGIDILVDLTMHLEGSRLLVFARKPAPVQVTYLAYCSTTGARTIDYRLTDPYFDPVDDDRYYSEKSVRLRSYWCYLAPRESVAAGPLPAETSDHITFGCLNNFSKVSPPVLAAWCQLLRRVPGSRLILHTHEGSHRREILERFATQGIESDRIEFVGYVAMERYLQMYNRIDIALDPFPYCGGTTTCDALWMGVPVVTFAGRTAVSRGGASLLSNLGLPELIATSAEQYIELAATLARDLPRLQSLRATLNARMKQSILMDAPVFARDVEAAYRWMWRSWCENKSLAPSLPAKTYFERANDFQVQGQFDDAIANHRLAIERNPQYAEAFNNLGIALRATGKHSEAMDCFAKATALQPQYADALNNLAVALREAGQLDPSLDACERALKANLDSVPARINLGNAHMAAGRMGEAIECYRQAETIDPHSIAAHNRLYALHFDPKYGPNQIREEHEQWAQRQTNPLQSLQGPPEPADCNPDRKLRIGYVSPDFRSHPVGRLILPLLENHDAEQFEIFCYSGVTSPDGFTQRAGESPRAWREIAALSNEQLAERIRRDRIDVLVDLTMHMDGSRLLAFARKPAPIQVTYLAYCGTTGMRAIDYRFTDPFLDPPDCDAAYTEKSIRLKTYWCYEPPPGAPEVVAPPSLKTGRLTFGCLNNFSKVSAAALAAWRQILKEVPGSRIVIHAPEGSHREQVRRDFADSGLDADRVEFISFLPHDEYLRTYQNIDIALDPFPYCGGTTTMDTLWMGVPVVTLAGATGVSRSGRSILSHLGLPELIATQPDQYAQVAIALARNNDQLRSFSSTLRDRMRASPLMNAHAFALDIESAYRRMWTCYCEQRTASRP